MAVWRQYQIGARLRRSGGVEERLALDRSAVHSSARAAGRPVTVRVYPSTAAFRVKPGLVTAGPNAHLARLLELYVEPGEVIAVRELSFGPSLADIIAVGPQSDSVVVAILSQLLDGLTALHSSGHSHLRLGPEAVRFDLLSGTLKIGDLEEAALLPEPSADLIPRYLEPDVRIGVGGPPSDIFSVGRLGEALLRGGAPLGAWGSTPVGASKGPSQALWAFLCACQETSGSGRPRDATAALAALRATGLSAAADATLPLSKFVRLHVGALRELRRWRAQPLSPLAEEAGETFREILCGTEAAKLWGIVGGGAVMAALLSAYLVGAPARGNEGGMRFSNEACADGVKASMVASPKDAPTGFVIATLQVPPDAAAAIDGCAVSLAHAGESLLAVEPGLHDFRIAVGEEIGVAKLEATIGSHPLVDLRSTVRARGDAISALTTLVKARANRDAEGPAMGNVAPDWSPVVEGMIDPEARGLVDVDAAVVEPDSEMKVSLSDGVALAFDGLRAAARRFAVLSSSCSTKLAASVDRELGPKVPGVDDDNLRRATALLTVTRIRGPELRAPLRVESDGLSKLGVTPGRRMLAAVANLSRQTELVSCLGELAAPAHEVDALAALILAQLPGAEQNQGDEGTTE